jgi:hypothetical protein
MAWNTGRKSPVAMNCRANRDDDNDISAGFWDDDWGRTSLRAGKGGFSKEFTAS